MVQIKKNLDNLELQNIVKDWRSLNQCAPYLPLQSSMAFHTTIKKTNELNNNFNTKFLFAFINTVTMKNITINKTQSHNKYYLHCIII